MSVIASVLSPLVAELGEPVPVFIVTLLAAISFVSVFFLRTTKEDLTRSTNVNQAAYSKVKASIRMSRGTNSMGPDAQSLIKR